MFTITSNGDELGTAIVNVSPIEWGHFLLVPKLSENLSQRLTRGAIQLGLEAINLSKDKHFRLMFNSLLAWASGRFLKVSIRPLRKFGLISKVQKLIFRDLYSKSLALSLFYLSWRVGAWQYTPTTVQVRRQTYCWRVSAESFMRGS